MKRLIAFTAIGSLLVAPLASADPRRGPPPGHRGPPGYSVPYHGYYGGHRYPYAPVYYRHGHHGHHDGNDSDDAAWAIGGLVLGAIIGTAAARAEQRKAVTCHDEVAYDREGDPYVARRCSDD